MINFDALFNVSYGLYIVSSGNKSNGNGFISNTVFQVTAEPIKFAICCHKNNYTAEFINRSLAFSVSILAQDTPSDIFGTFGYKSGRDMNKMEGMNVKYGETGVPIVLNGSIAYLEFEVEKSIDLGTHIMYFGDLINAEMIDDSKEPITYLYYRQVKRGLSPKNAPTYIDKSKFETKPVDLSLKKYKCTACGYIYDDSVEEVKYNQLPADWVCPVCGSEKEDFIEIN